MCKRAPRFGPRRTLCSLEIPPVLIRRPPRGRTARRRRGDTRAEVCEVERPPQAVVAGKGATGAAGNAEVAQVGRCEEARYVERERIVQVEKPGRAATGDVGLRVTATAGRAAAPCLRRDGRYERLVRLRRMRTDDISAVRQCQPRAARTRGWRTSSSVKCSRKMLLTAQWTCWRWSWRWRRSRTLSRPACGPTINLTSASASASVFAVTGGAAPGAPLGGAHIGARRFRGRYSSRAPSRARRARSRNQTHKFGGTGLQPGRRSRSRPLAHEHHALRARARPPRAALIRRPRT